MAQVCAWQWEVPINIEWCQISTSMAYDGRKTTLNFPNGKFIFQEDKKSGTLTVGSTVRNYSRLTHFTANDIAQVFDSEACRKARGQANDTSASATNSGACKTYIKKGSCSNGRAAVDCSNSYYCIDEHPGADYPSCVPRNQLIDRNTGSRCDNVANCQKCP